MDGVLVVDKPQGITSHDVVAAARRALAERRIGHTGTLDPLATGVLPLACGQATRLSRFLTAADKTYEAAIRFGVSTDTYDITGTTVADTGRVPDRDAIERGLASLRGEYEQAPPAFSAKRVGRERAYALARRNQEVDLRPVRVRVTRAELLDLTGSTALITISCSSGFYVRTFAHTLGELTGTGACLAALRRTRSGDFTIDCAVPFEEILTSPAAARARVVEMHDLLPGLPAAHLTLEGRERVAHGRTLEPAHLVSSPELTRAEGGSGGPPWVRLIGPAGDLVAMATPGAGGALHPAVVLV